MLLQEIYGEEDQAGQDVKAGVAGTAYSGCTPEYALMLLRTGIACHRQ